MIQVSKEVCCYVEYLTTDFSEAKFDHGTTITVNGNYIYVGGDTACAVAKDSTAQYTYTFSKWLIDGVEILDGEEYTLISNVVITAHFTRTLNKYDVTFEIDNPDYGYFGSADVKTTTVSDVPYGTDIVSSATVVTIDNKQVILTVLPDTAQYDYSFTGWTGISNILTGDMTIIAHISRKVIDYTLTFTVNIAGYGTVSTPSIVAPYGTAVTVENNKITVGNASATATAKDTTQIDDGYTYSFVDWNNVPSTIEGNAIITANFTRVAKTYTITYDLGFEGLTLDNPTTYTIETNDITLINPEMAGYIFAGWSGTGLDGTIKNVTIKKGSFGDRSYKAVWLVPVSIEQNGAQSGNTYSVTVKDSKGSTQTYQTGFNLIKDEVYSISVSVKLKNANASNNEYQISRVGINGVGIETIASPMNTQLTNKEIFNNKVVESFTINIEFFNAYMLKLTETTAIYDFSVNVINQGNNVIVKNHSSNYYIVANGSEVTLNVNATPGQSGYFTYIGLQYVTNGENANVGVNGNANITLINFKHNTQYTNDANIGTYVYSINPNANITEISVQAVLSFVAEITTNEQTVFLGTITLTSEHGFNKVIDKSTKNVVLYDGIWTVTKTEMTFEQISKLFSNYKVTEDANGVIKIHITQSNS